VPVVDASVVVDWVAPDSDATGPARLLLARLAEHDETVSAPRLMLQEVSNALLTGVRRRRWNGTAADEAFGRLRELPVDVDDVPADLDRAWELSRRYDEHPLYDMVYVALAERLGEPLITADVRLGRKLAARGSVLALDDTGSSAV
jgi:predicted nucleic acid-binding protein